MRVALVALLCLLFYLGGSLMTYLVFNIPNKPAEYTIRSKTACLPDDGVNFKLAYRGTGEATFVVLPPEPTTTTVETKEKK